MATERDENDVWQRIADYRREVEFLRELLDPVNQLRDASVFVEDLLRVDFPAPEIAEPSLRKLLLKRRDFLGRKLFRDADFALRMRNSVSHTRLDENTEKQFIKATDVFLEIATRHIDEIERRAGPRATSANQPVQKQDSPARFTAETSQESKPKIYATKIKREPRPLLEATDNAPEVTASTVAEYTFCPRAGILTHEGGFSDPEEELPSLALLPWYEQEVIEEAYTHALYVLFAFPVGLLVTVVILSLSMLGSVLYPYLLAGLIIVWAPFAFRAFRRWREIGGRRLAALLATECNPVPGKNAFQPVDWWGLLLAGYEVRRPEDSLKDERWKLSGKPRRILDKGTMSIPVHRIRKPEGPILPQHIVRVMAHCHLIETTEGANSPFAVILFGNTYKGMTVPNTPENRERFYTAIERTRAAITESDNGERQPPEPITGNACSACHFGHPRPIALEDKTMRYGEPLDPVLFHNGRKVFHCDCGDRFNWKPKHDRTRKMGKLG
ncbi:MAG TPA: hypothetical protein DDW52_27850 [Planctomycetaceae bacterium]|nr:hypothetical protein [Planctomycetaceae bacterium]